MKNAKKMKSFFVTIYKYVGHVWKNYQRSKQNLSVTCKDSI